MPVSVSRLPGSIEQLPAFTGDLEVFPGVDDRRADGGAGSEATSLIVVTSMFTDAGSEPRQPRRGAEMNASLPSAR